MKKRNIWAIVITGVIVLILGIVIAFCVIKSNEATDQNSYTDCVTRQEWIVMLDQYMGVTNAASKQPYFQDVPVSDQNFEFIQSAVEWGLIEADESFHGSDYASGSFIAATAIRSVGDARIRLSLGIDQELKDEDYISIALENGLIQEEQLKRGLTADEAAVIIEKLDELYYGVFWQRDIEEFEYQDRVIELEKAAVTVYDRDAETLNCSEQLKVGDIVSFMDGGLVTVRKVGKLLDNGSYGLEMPQMEEAFQSLKQSEIGEVTFQNVIDYYGKDNLIVADSGAMQKSSAVAVSHSISNTAQTKGFRIEAEQSEEQLDVYITDNDTGIRYQLPVASEISKDYENFSASLDVSRIFVGSQLDYSAAEGVTYADVAVDIETSVGVGMQSEKDISDRTMLFETPAPLGSGLVGVDIQVYLVTTLSGKIYLEAELPYQIDICYEKGKGIRYFQHDFQIKEPKIEASAEITNQIGIVPILVVGQFEPVIDAELGGSVITKADVNVHDNHQICTDVEAVYPVIDLSVGQSDVEYKDKQSIVARLGYSGSWSIISEEDAPQRLSLHFEVLPDQTTQFVDECTYKKETAKKKSVEKNSGDRILDELLRGDFSRYAGTYIARESDNDAYGGGEKLADLKLHADGTVSGGRPSYCVDDPYPANKPISVAKNEDGSYLCVLADNDGVEDKYYIYPKGVADDYIGDDTFLLDTVYIRYMRIDGGVLDIVYYKDKNRKQKGQKQEKNSDLKHSYDTQEQSTPIFRISYPDGWTVEQNYTAGDQENMTLSNDSGIHIDYISAKYGFGSQYYGALGGDTEMAAAHITKVADVAFKPSADSGLGKMVIAKIKEYALEDGLTGERRKIDGVTYYAVVPKSYLGDTMFSASGYWAACAWEYGRPTAIIAQSSDGNFTSDQEKEVIQILSSFTEK